MTRFEIVAGQTSYIRIKIAGRYVLVLIARACVVLPDDMSAPSSIMGG